MGKQLERIADALELANRLRATALAREIGFALAGSGLNEVLSAAGVREALGLPPEPRIDPLKFPCSCGHTLGDHPPPSDGRYQYSCARCDCMRFMFPDPAVEAASQHTEPRP